MAIKILSKNIYEIDNPKVRDNLINNVAVEQTVVAPNNEYDIIVYTNIYKEFYDNEQSNNYSFKYVLVGGSGTPWGYSLSYSGYKKHKFLQNTEIEILTTLKNKYISDLILGERDGFSNIKYGIYGVKTTTNVSCNYNGTINDNIGDDTLDVSFSIEDCVFSNQQITPIQQYNIPNELSYTADYDKDYGGELGIETTSNVKVSKLDNLNVASYDIKEINGEEYFVITIKDILCGVETYQMKNSAPSLTTSISGKLEGEYCKYEPSYIELNIYGNTIGIDLTDGTVTYGNGNKPHSLTANELLQDSSKVKTKDESGNDIQLPITKHLANNVLKQYAVGKETATLLCDINEYYDENGDLVISTEKSGLPMTFNIGNEVIPYVFGANGQDKPMSLYRDGKPKVFRVIGTNTIYDGAVWQELTLQEVTKG